MATASLCRYFDLGFTSQPCQCKHHMVLFVPPKQYLLLLWFCLLKAFTVEHKSKQKQDIWSAALSPLVILTAHARFWAFASHGDRQPYVAIIGTSHGLGHILCLKSYTPMHIRGASGCMCGGMEAWRGWMLRWKLSGHFWGPPLPQHAAFTELQLWSICL